MLGNNDAAAHNPKRKEYSRLQQSTVYTPYPESTVDPVLQE